MTHEGISEEMTIPSKYIEVNGEKMHYLEAGEGDPILFLHGIPASAYVWRNIIPHLTSLGRCIAPDLMGFGQSAKPNIDYSIHDHINYLAAFIQALGLKKITFVLHGWGSIIGLNYAMSHEKNCKGLVMYEAFLRSLNADEASLPFQEQLLWFEDEAVESDNSQDAVSFIDRLIGQTVMRTLSAQELNHYREPFIGEGASKPIMSYLRELPRGNGKGEVDKIIAEYSDKLTSSSLPKLLLYSVPGFVTTIATLMWAKEHLPNIEIIEVGEELHLGQESNPQLMGETISVWMQGVEQNV